MGLLNYINYNIYIRFSLIKLFFKDKYDYKYIKTI